MPGGRGSRGRGGGRLVGGLRRSRSTPTSAQRELVRAVRSNEPVLALSQLQRGADPNVPVPAARPSRRRPSTEPRSPFRAASPARSLQTPRFLRSLSVRPGAGSARGVANEAFSPEEEDQEREEEEQGQETLLHQAARLEASHLVRGLLEHGAAPGALDSLARTPLHEAVLADAPVETLQLLVTARGAPLDAQDVDGNTALHLACQRHNRAHIVTLLEAGARADLRNRAGRTALRHLVREFPPALLLAMDGCLRLEPDTQSVEFDYSLLDPCLLDDKEVYDERFMETRLLNSVDNVETRDRLFLHPVCKSFLKLKWKVIAPFYIFDVVMFALFVVSFNVFMFSVVDAHLNNGTVASSAAAFTATLNSSGVGGGYNFDVTVFDVPLSTITFSVVAVLCLGIAVRELAKLWVLGPWAYVRGPENLVLWLCTGTAVVCLTSDLMELRVIRQVGAVCLLVSWTELLFLFGRAEFASSHIMLFATVVRSMTVFMMVYTAVTFAFTSSFFVLFCERMEFSNMFQSFFSTVVMSIGELNYSPDQLEGSDLGYAVYLLFVFFMLIITMNAMVSVAVNDTRNMAERAEVKLHKKYLEFAVVFERHMAWRSRGGLLWGLLPPVGVTLLSLMPRRRLTPAWGAGGPAGWRRRRRVMFGAWRGDQKLQEESTAVLRRWLAEWPGLARQALSVVLARQQTWRQRDWGAEPDQVDAETGKGGWRREGAGGGQEEGPRDGDVEGEDGDGSQESEEEDVGDGGGGGQESDQLAELRHAVLDLKCQLGQVQTELFKISKALSNIAFTQRIGRVAV